jgi:sugar phosphate isomerase/epimerase
VDALRSLANDAARLGLMLAVENHNDALGDAAELATFVRAVNHPNLGVCLDFGNFAEGQELDGVRLLAPLAVHAHAKCWAFDAAGEETRLNYRATMAALSSAGFSGIASIDYEGNGDPNQNAVTARALIQRYVQGRPGGPPLHFARCDKSGT